MSAPLERVTERAVVAPAAWGKADDAAKERDGATPVLGLTGSLRRDSYNRKLLQAAVAAAPEGVDVVTWEGLKEVPPFDEDDEHAPGAVVDELRRAIARADALLVVTPEYNGSLPGQLKNALDWASRPRRETVLRDKPAAVIGASPSPGGARSAQADARRVLARAGAVVLDDELAVARAHERFDADGQPIDVMLRADLAALVASVARAGSAHSSPELATPSPRSPDRPPDDVRRDETQLVRPRQARRGRGRAARVRRDARVATGVPGKRRRGGGSRQPPHPQPVGVRATRHCGLVRPRAGGRATSRPLMTKPSELIGVGTVLWTDLIPYTGS